MLKKYLSYPAHISLLVISLLFILPFLPNAHLAPISSFVSQSLAGLVGLLASVYLLSKARWQSIHIPHIAFVFLGLAIILAMQWLLGMLYSSQFALMVLAYLLWAAVLTILGGQIKLALAWSDIVPTLAWASLFGALLNLVWIAVQHIHPAAALYYVPGAELGFYMALALVSTLYLSAKQKIKPVFALVLMMTFLVTLIFSALYVGAALVVLISVLALSQQALAVSQHRPSLASRRIVRLGVALLVLYIVAYLVLHYLLAGTQHAQAALWSPLAQQWAQILAIWQKTWSFAIHAWYLGTGLGQLPWVSFNAIEHPIPHGTAGVIENTHSLWLQLFAEMGIGAVVLVLVGSYSWLKAFGSKNINAETWWVLSVLALILALSFISSVWMLSYILGISAFLLGAGERQNKVLRLPKLGVIFTLLFVLIGVGVLLTSCMAYCKLAHVVPLAKLEKPSSAQQMQIDKSLQWVGDYSLLTPYAMPIYAETLTLDPAAIDIKVWLSASAQHWIPSRKLAYRHVLLLKLQGKDELAVQYLRRSLFAYPGKFEAELEAMPFAYWQDYLDVLSIASPIKSKS